MITPLPTPNELFIKIKSFMKRNDVKNFVNSKLIFNEYTRSNDEPFEVNFTRKYKDLPPEFTLAEFYNYLLKNGISFNEPIEVMPIGNYFVAWDFNEFKDNTLIINLMFDY